MAETCPESCIYIAVCTFSARSATRIVEEANMLKPLLEHKERLLEDPALLDMHEEETARATEEGFSLLDEASRLVSSLETQRQAFERLGERAMGSCQPGPGDDLPEIPGKKACRSDLPHAHQHSVNLIADPGLQGSIARQLQADS